MCVASNVASNLSWETDLKPILATTKAATPMSQDSQDYFLPHAIRSTLQRLLGTPLTGNAVSRDRITESKPSQRYL